MDTLWINARFLDRPTTGVERVARQILDTLSREYLDANGELTLNRRRFCVALIAPAAGDATSPWPNIPLKRHGRLGGHAWEQFELPRATAGDWLLSLCNTGPLIKRRHVVFLHDAQPFAIPENFSWAFRNWYRLLFNGLGRAASRILVNSSFTANELAQRVGLDLAKMTLCPLGVDHLPENVDADAVLSDCDLPSAPFMLAVSSANPNKNFGSVVDALSQLGADAPPAVIVGQRQQGHFGSVTLSADSVRHLGFVSDEQLLALYQRARVLLFPSFYEGFGLPPVEAMSQGCPVIASNTSAIPEVCGEAALYIDPNDPAQLAAAIRRVFDDDALAQSLTDRGRANAAEFRWRRCTRAVIEGLEAALSTPGSEVTASRRRVR